MKGKKSEKSLSRKDLNLLPNMKKRMIFIIPITKDEAMFIRKNCPKVHVSKPTTNGRRFMEEEKEAMKLLKAYRRGDHNLGGKK